MFLFACGGKFEAAVSTERSLSPMAGRTEEGWTLAIETVLDWISRARFHFKWKMKNGK
jgi:hypothetical protein